jgi:uncharacterized protein YbjT (DUF2867 family)
MPVLITGATGLVGRALASRLVDEGAQVRAYVRRDDPRLRALGVHVAVGSIDEVERLEAALTRVHTIVHLIGGILPERGVSYDYLNRDTTESAAIAARAAGVRRFVFLSFPGADPASDNEFLAAKGRAEEHVLAGGLEHAILRSAPIVESLPVLFDRLARGAVVSLPGRGTQRFNPVALEAVIDALVASDAREADVRDVRTLAGDEVITMNDAVERFAPGKRPVRLRGFGGIPKALGALYGRDLIVEPTPI